MAVGVKGGPKPVTFTNSGSSAVSIAAIAISGANAADFAIYGKTCGASVAASASCTATIVFAPTAAGTRTASLKFTDSASGSPQTVALSGLGTASSSTGGGSASVSPATLNWNSVAVGNKGGPKSVTLSNNGSTAITIGSIAISGANPGDFLISAKTCGASLAASASCTATILFAPTLAGTRAATLQFTDAASNSPQTMALTGKGTGGSGSTTFSISPLNPSVNVNATLQFSASSTATWKASCGSMSATGLFTAPATAGACTVTATSTAAATAGKTASTTVTVTSPGTLAVTPAHIAMHAIGTQQFTANEPVTWSASCGAITAAGVFTAPASAGTCTISATSKSNNANKATATAAVSVVDYTMRKNGPSQTGLQSSEFALTPSSVSSGNFKQSWSAGVDGGVWGQPLYINAIAVGGKTRNVLYVTTANDSVYAFDADTGSQLWKTSFLSSGVTAVPGASVKISSQTGILSTPAIDAGKQILYVVAETMEDNGASFIHRLHALSLVTGKEMLDGPVVISHANLPPVMKFQRPSLLLANGTIYVAFGSIEDRTPYHGLLFAFNENTLAQEAVFDPAGTGSQSGIWMSGAPPSADDTGNVYVSVANGTFNGANAFGESIVKLSPNLQELDYFTPYAYAVFNEDDTDMGAGGVMVLPDQNGPYPHILIACGKPTPIYVLNRDSMGGVGSTSDNILQRLDGQLGARGNWRDSGQPCYNTPAMWQQKVYFAANHDVLKIFTLDAGTGHLSATPTAKGSFLYQWPGADPVVSANGDDNAIVWTVDYATSTLHANDATTLAPLYTSSSLGAAVRWVPPTVANGHVYVALQGKVVCFGVPPTP